MLFRRELLLLMVSVEHHPKKMELTWDLIITRKIQMVVVIVHTVVPAQRHQHRHQEKLMNQMGKEHQHPNMHLHPQVLKDQLLA